MCSRSSPSTLYLPISPSAFLSRVFSFPSSPPSFHSSSFLLIYPIQLSCVFSHRCRNHMCVVYTQVGGKEGGRDIRCLSFRVCLILLNMSSHSIHFLTAVMILFFPTEYNCVTYMYHIFFSHCSVYGQQDVAVEDVEKDESLHFAGGNAGWYTTTQLVYSTEVPQMSKGRISMFYKS